MDFKDLPKARALILGYGQTGAFMTGMLNSIGFASGLMTCVDPRAAERAKFAQDFPQGQAFADIGELADEFEFCAMTTPQEAASALTMVRQLRIPYAVVRKQTPPSEQKLERSLRAAIFALAGRDVVQKMSVIGSDGVINVIREGYILRAP